MSMIGSESSTQDHPPRPSDTFMKKANETDPADEMRDEYDFRGGERGKYYKRYREGTNIVLLDPDIVKVLRDSETVNNALRQILSEHGESQHVAHTDARSN